MSEQEYMELRPHHIYCRNFMSFSDPTRGARYNEAVKKLEKVFLEEKDTLIKIKEGIDFLCRECPYCNGSDCIHPRGSEEEVRKWDKRVLGESGLEFGAILKSEEIGDLIRKRHPLDFCLKKCLYHKRGNCDPNKAPQHFQF